MDCVCLSLIGRSSGGGGSSSIPIHYMTNDIPCSIYTIEKAAPTTTTAAAAIVQWQTRETFRVYTFIQQIIFVKKNIRKQSLTFDFFLILINRLQIFDAGYFATLSVLYFFYLCTIDSKI